MPVESESAEATSRRSGAIHQEKNNSDNDTDEWLIFCRCEKAKAIYTLLSCLRNVGTWSNRRPNDSGRDLTQSRRSRTVSSVGAATIQPVTVFCYPKTMTFHMIGRSKQIQASVNMQAGLFSTYNLLQHAQGNENDASEDWHSEGEFCVNLSTVLQCLNLLGTNSLERMKLSMSYNLSQETFKLELTDDSGVLSTATIPGMEPPEDDLGQSLALAMRSSPIAARLIIKSDTLREILVELESVGGAKVGTVSLDSKALEVAVVGDLSECLVSIPCRGEHVVSLECPSSTSNAYSFPLHSLLGSLRGLEIAEETCITMNKNGMMAIQHQVIDATTGDGSPSFVDFIMCCLDDQDESSADPNADAAQSCYTQDSHSQSLKTRRIPASHPLTRDDDQSRTVMSSVRDHGLAYESGDETDDDGDDPAGSTVQSASSLFGSLVRDIEGRPHKADGTTRRVTKRNRSAPSQKRQVRKYNDDSDTSRDLLGDSSSSEGENGPEEHDDNHHRDEEELQALDVSTRRNNHNDHLDRGNTSSPELVYGHQS